MKKTVVFIIIALVAVSSAFAFEFKSVGLETGVGIYASLDMDIIENLDVYGRIGYNGYFSLTGGAQYFVYEFDVERTDIEIRPGAQLNLNFSKYGFNFGLLGTCEFSFETNHFGAFARPGLGFGVTFYEGLDDKIESDASFAFAIETGVRYLF